MSLAMCAALLFATVQFPDTIAGRQSALWLQAFNSGSYDTIRAFYAATSPAASVDADTLYAYEAYLDTRGFDVIRVEQSSDLEIRLVTRERVSGQWGAVRLQYRREPPFAQTAFGYAYSYAPAVPGKRGAEEIATQLDAVMQKLSAADVFSGAVLVAKDDRVIYRKSFGLASKAYGVVNRPDTKFNIASITKLFTAVAVLQLAEAGKLSFADPVGKYLPDYPNKDVAAKVTIHQLLTHTSGIARQPRQSDAANALRPRLRTVNAWFPLFSDKPNEFEPGTAWHYSNEGYIVLGAIVERVSGSSYFDYVQEHLFKAAGMTNSGFYELDNDTPNMATGYTRFRAATRADVENRRNNSLMNFVKGSPAGGAYSTVDDLLKFKVALLTNRLLSPKFTLLMTNGVVETGDAETRQAYGFVDHTVDGQHLIEHSGAIPGGEARLEIYLQGGYTVVSLSNYDYQVVHRILRDLILQH